MPAIPVRARARLRSSLGPTGLARRITYVEELRAAMAGGVWWCVRLETYGFSPDRTQNHLGSAERSAYGRAYNAHLTTFGVRCVYAPFVRAKALTHYARYVTPPHRDVGCVRSTLHTGGCVSEVPQAPNHSTVSGGDRADYPASEARRAERAHGTPYVEQAEFLSFLLPLFSFLCRWPAGPSGRKARPSGLRPIRATCPPIVRASYGQAGRRSPSGRMAGGHYGHSPFGATKKIPPTALRAGWPSVFSEKKIPPMREFCALLGSKLSIFTSIYLQFIINSQKMCHFYDIFIDVVS